MNFQFFSNSKAGHIGLILSQTLLGQAVTQELTPPDPSTIELYGHLVIQILVAVVTIWATIRKALQKPETVVKLPADAVPVLTSGPSGSASSAPGDGEAQ